MGLLILQTGSETKRVMSAYNKDAVKAVKVVEVDRLAVAPDAPTRQHTRLHIHVQEANGISDIKLEDEISHDPKVRQAIVDKSDKIIKLLSGETEVADLRVEIASDENVLETADAEEDTETPAE